MFHIVPSPNMIPKQSPQPWSFRATCQTQISLLKPMNAGSSRETVSLDLQGSGVSTVTETFLLPPTTDFSQQFSQTNHNLLFSSFLYLVFRYEEAVWMTLCPPHLFLGLGIHLPFGPYLVEIWVSPLACFSYSYLKRGGELSSTWLPWQAWGHSAWSPPGLCRPSPPAPTVFPASTWK